MTVNDGSGASSVNLSWTISPKGTGNVITVTPPANQTGTVGTAASLQIQATDSAAGQTLTYSAAGLPAGLTISSTTGLISGTPTTTGNLQRHRDRHRHHRGEGDSRLHLDRSTRKALIPSR